MSEETVKKILSACQIEFKSILPAEKGYRSTVIPVEVSDRIINLILYKDEPDILSRIKRANLVGDYLAQKGLPARSTYINQVVKLSNANSTRYVCLYNYLPGNTLPWEAYTMDHLKALGTAMAHIHQTLSLLNTYGFLDITEENLLLNQQINAYLLSPDVIRAMASKLSLKTNEIDFKKTLLIARGLKEKQVLHMDFVRGNILYEGKKISGVLDLEKVGVGHKLFDIARTLAFLIVDCKYKDEQHVRKYFLNSGYIKHGHGVINDYIVSQNSLLEELIKFFMLHDFYKFLKHNPYEFLEQNEHFVRTKAYLMKTGLVVKL